MTGAQQTDKSAARPVKPRAPKLDPRLIPSAMETLAASWRR